MNHILELAHEHLSYCKEWKKLFHEHPEVSFQEFETSKQIRAELVKLDIPIIDIGLATGVVGFLTGAKPGKTIALRADIDAIHLTEEPGNPGSSHVDGVMHACGHDFHTAALLGTAKMLARLKEQLHGNVVFLFQPAEETLQGAKAMLNQRVLTKLPHKIDMIFGLHNRPEIPSGKIGLKRGVLMAEQASFTVQLKGLSGHGGMPHECIDVIVPAAAMIQAIQSIISRNLDPFEPAVCSVCSINGGTADNFIIDHITFSGLIRTLQPATQNMISERIQAIINHHALAFGCEFELAVEPIVPRVFNTDAMYDLAQDTARHIVGEDNLLSPQPCLGSEDFSVYAEQFPSFFYWVGTGFTDQENPEWHSPSFQTNDDALVIAMALLTQSVLSGQKIGNIL